MIKKTRNNISRRGLLASGATLAGVLAAPAVARAQATAGRLVIVGGGFGGASAARAARDRYPNIAVTLIEPASQFVTCPYGNLVLAGRSADLAGITHSYDKLVGRGVTKISQEAREIDAAKKTVRTADNQTVAYDRLIVSPGIDLKWDAIKGYDRAASAVMPHCWVPSLQPVTALADKLKAMADGGTFIMVAPPNPFRCPPGPYERASMVAEYFKKAKPKSKILILDAKDGFSKQPLFLDAWKALYGDMIEWVPANKEGKVVAVDPAAMTVETEFGKKHKGDVVNVIPPQQAARIARESGLTGGADWAAIDTRTFEIKSAPGVFVIGDANAAPPMPKSGFVANNTAMRAVAVACSQMTGAAIPNAIYFNTCYSHVGENYGISVVGVYRPNADGTKIDEAPNSGGISAQGATPDIRAGEATYADGWYRSITNYMFG
ncbi:MAG: cytochrome C [Alphaproteobacteria bacterium]|nr:cytochrome C [Alphaproteobacteria bacterium]